MDENEHLINQYFYFYHNTDNTTGLPVVTVGCLYPWGVVTYGYAPEQWMEILKKEIILTERQIIPVPKQFKEAFGEV